MKTKSVKKYDEKISTFIFNLRNKIYVRKNSLNRKKIKYKDHKVWLKNFFKKKNTLYLILNHKKIIGYIRLELKKNVYDTSWALEKKYQRKGITKKYLKLATNKKKLVYMAKIKKNNFASIKVAHYAKFRLKIIRNKICYLYKNKF
tara:strand:- start:40 stop:477 length:438 start_codon:yes stop_codon:yes gene_type:complete